MSIQVRNLRKAFGGFVALDDVSLDVPGGELVALLGPSGSGKTTLLRIIAGLEPADQGTIHFHGEDATTQPVRERQVGFVFQHYALFRHMSVFENVAFGLRVRPQAVPSLRGGDPRHASWACSSWCSSTCSPSGGPSELSGGQRQRVALARALAVKPKVLLLDEPFGALDAKVRKELRRWLRRLHEEVHVTSVFVTHDQEEALEVSDRVVIMNEGRVEQSGTPEEVYEQPGDAVRLRLPRRRQPVPRSHSPRAGEHRRRRARRAGWAEARDQAGVAYVRTLRRPARPVTGGGGLARGGRAPRPRVRTGDPGGARPGGRTGERSRRTSRGASSIRCRSPRASASTSRRPTRGSSRAAPIGRDLSRAPLVGGNWA